MRRTLAALAVLLAFAVGAQADRTDDLIREWMKATNTPGMAVAVWRDGRMVKEAGFGRANLEAGNPATPATVFEVGSITKAFTAVAVMILVEEGKLTLDDPVSKFLPEAPEVWKDLTLRRALSHTAGLPDYLGIVGFNLRRDYRMSELVELASKNPLEYAPGDTWMYSNGGYVLAGMAIEEVSGMRWGRFIEERIIDQLELEHTLIQAPSRVVPGRAAGYTWNGRSWNNAEILRPTAAYAAGAVLSTVGDLVRFARASSDGTLISRESFAEISAPTRLNSGRTFEYGMGWFTRDAFGARRIGHGGNTFGFSAELAIFPDQRTVVAVLGNVSGQSYAPLTDLIVRPHIPNPVVDSWKVKADPDRRRTLRLIAAVNAVVRGTLDDTLLDPEMVATLKSTRGKTITSQLAQGLGRVKGMLYMGEKKVEDDVVIVYDVVGTISRRSLPLRVAPDGRLVRLGE